MSRRVTGLRVGVGVLDDPSAGGTTTFCAVSGSGDRRKSVQHLEKFASAPVRVDVRRVLYEVLCAAEVLKPQVSSSPFGHFWDCGQK